MTEGREVVEDYRTLQLSLRAQPLSFLREELDGMGIVRCAELPHIRDGRNIEVAGVILVRQRPGSAKGVLFVTIEDETGIAIGILWPDRFDIYRRSEERRVGKGCGSTCISRVSPDHEKKKKKTT